MSEKRIAGLVLNCAVKGRNVFCVESAITTWPNSLRTAQVLPVDLISLKTLQRSCLGLTKFQSRRTLVSGYGIDMQRAVRDARVDAALVWIQQQIAVNDIDLDNLAKAVNLSSSRLRYLFQLYTGTTPRRYHKLLRLQKAQSLLRESFLNVKQVMAEVGWTDESHFSRDYKRLYGESPSKSRFTAMKNGPVPLGMA